MLKRKVYHELLRWKEQRRSEQVRKCLLLKGARQVGKSFIIEEFGKKEYASFLKIDFFLQPNLKGIFDGELTADEILKRITAYVRDLELIPGNTQLFLDEIQYCGNARTAIKYLAMVLKQGWPFSMTRSAEMPYGHVQLIHSGLYRNDPAMVSARSSFCSPSRIRRAATTRRSSSRATQVTRSSC